MHNIPLLSAVTEKRVFAPEAHKIVLGDRKLKLREISDTLKVSEGSVFTILHESLGMRKLFSKWVSRLFPPDQKQQRIKDSERSLKLFKRGKKWTAAGESHPKRPKTQQWAVKVMTSVFWDAHRVLFIDYLEKGKTISSD